MLTQGSLCPMKLKSLMASGIEELNSDETGKARPLLP